MRRALRLKIVRGARSASLKRPPRDEAPGDPTQTSEASAVLASLWEEDAEVWQTRWAPVFREFAEEVVRRADLKPSEWALDIGTGTGTVARLAASKVGAEGKVVGVDRSGGMVERARMAAAAEQSLAKALRMDVGALEFPDDWFHAALSNDGVPYVGMREALSEVRRVLRPAGRFVFSEWATDKVAAVRIFEDVFAQHKTMNPSARLRRFRDALGVWTEAAERLGEREGFEQALKAAGFRQVRGETISHTVSRFTLDDFIDARLARAVAKLEYSEMTAGAREQFDRGVREALAHLVHGGQFEVLWPVFYVSAAK